MAASSAPNLVNTSNASLNPPQITTTTVLKAGFLTKEGAFIKSWTENWFELTPLQLTYYSDNTPTRLERGYFMLGDLESIRFCPRKYGDGSCIAVATKTRTYYIRGSKTELSDWLVALGDSTKALRYCTTLNLVRNGTHLLTLALRDPLLASKPEKLAKKDEKVMKELGLLSSLDVVHSEWLFTHERLAVKHLCLLGFSTPREGGDLLLHLYPGAALRFYNSTDWVKEYKSDKYYTTGYVNTTTTTSSNVGGNLTNTTVTRQGSTVREHGQTTLWSSSMKKKLRAPNTFAMLEDHPSWGG